MEQYAQIDQDNVVVQVVVAESETIRAGVFGNPNSWFKIGPDTLSKDVGCPGNPAYRYYAGIGYRYSKQLDKFLPPDLS